eukprot:1995284-Rhodomonas_salina.1
MFSLRCVGTQEDLAQNPVKVSQTQLMRAMYKMARPEGCVGVWVTEARCVVLTCAVLTWSRRRRRTFKTKSSPSSNPSPPAASTPRS